MRRSVYNFFILVLLLACFLSFLYDIFRWFQSGSDFLRLGEFWYFIHASSLNLVQAIIQRYIWAPLWDNFFVFILILPVWVFMSFILMLLIYFTYGRRY